MNKEDYVSLEVAKILKEKGYDEPCCKMYNEKEEGYEYACYMMTKQGFRNYDLCEYEVSIPTLYEAAKWLRNEHDINVAVATAIPAWIDRVPNDNGTLYMPLIVYKKEEGKAKMAILRNLADSNYEKVCNDAILEALKLI